MPTIKAIIFDMDGVLVDAKEWHYEALNRALGLFGFTITRFEHLSRYDGLPTRMKLQYLTQDKGFPASLHDIAMTLKQKYLLEEARRLCRPNPVHQDALSRLKKDGFRLAMASNSIRATVDFLVERTGLDPFLDFHLSNQDVERPKPDPEIYAKAIERLGLDPYECVAVEDGAYGIESARGAGLRVFEVEHINDVNYTGLRQFVSELDASVDTPAA